MLWRDFKPNKTISGLWTDGFRKNRKTKRDLFKRLLYLAFGRFKTETCCFFRHVFPGSRSHGLGAAAEPLPPSRQTRGLISHASHLSGKPGPGETSVQKWLFGALTPAVICPSWITIIILAHSSKVSVVRAERIWFVSVQGAVWWYQRLAERAVCLSGRDGACRRSFNTRRLRLFKKTIPIQKVLTHMVKPR